MHLCVYFLIELFLVCVYDISKFAKYHPGGIDILLENAGTNATEAFRMVSF